MKRYRVNVNGNDYEIGIELLDEVACTSEKAAAPSAPSAASTPVTKPAGATSITSPMPGTILSVNFQQGSNVKKGDTIMILEAMKMENEILAPCEGKLISISVTKGSTVESGSLLCTIG